MKTPDSTFSARLRTAYPAGRPVAELADILGVPTRTVYAWLAGTNTPRPIVQDAILDKLRRHPAPTP